MEQTLKHLNAQPQNIQLYSQSCCDVVIQSQNSSSVQAKNKSLTKMSNQKNKEKGIKLIHTQSQRAIRSNRQGQKVTKNLLKESTSKCNLQHVNLINSRKPQDLGETAQNRNTKKCIEYKNRKIAERTCTQSKFTINCGGFQHKIQSNVTQKYTPRTTIKSDEGRLELSQHIDKDLQLSWIIIAQQPKVQFGISTQNKFFKPTKSKKTLQKLYEQELGRRVVTLQSQDEENEGDLVVSVIQPYQWRAPLN